MIKRAKDGSCDPISSNRDQATSLLSEYNFKREAKLKEDEQKKHESEKDQNLLLKDSSASGPSSAEIVGYMPLRGDFNIEYDNDAELLLADMEFFDDDKKEETELKYEILKLYNAKLDERIRRKKFVIERGLLDIKRQQQLDRKRSKEEREIYAQMRPFMRFCSSAEEFKQFVEGLIEERQLRQRCEELKLFRSLGLQTFEQVDKYLEKKRPEGDGKKLIGASLPGMQSFIGKPNIGREIGSSGSGRAPRAKEHSTEIAKAPGFEELNEKEKELCLVLTVNPKSYLEIKEKMEEKLKGSRAPLKRAEVLEFADKKMAKDKAFAIFDFVVHLQEDEKR